MYKLGDMSKAVMILFDIYSVKRKTEAYVDGELTETFAANEDFTGAVLPMTGKELRNLPEWTLCLVIELSRLVGSSRFALRKM